MAANVADLLKVPRLYSNNPEFRTARLALNQPGVDFLLWSRAQFTEVRGEGKPHRVGIHYLKTELAAGEARLTNYCGIPITLKVMRFVVPCSDFPMGSLNRTEPMLWVRASPELETVQCWNRLSHRVTGRYEFADYCNRPVPEPEALSCVYCGVSMCHICIRTGPRSGAGPVCNACARKVEGFYERERIP